MDDDLAKFEELTSGVELSRRAKRDARRAASREVRRRANPPRPAPRVQQPRSPRTSTESTGVLARLVQWAESRALTQARPWGR